MLDVLSDRRRALWPAFRARDAEADRGRRPLTAFGLSISLGVGQQWVESVSSGLQATNFRPQVRGATGGRPRRMTAALSIPVFDSAVLPGEPMTASCQAP